MSVDGFNHDDSQLNHSPSRDPQPEDGAECAVRRTIIQALSLWLYDFVENTASRTSGAIEKHPGKARVAVAVFVVIGLIVAFTRQAHAQVPTSSSMLQNEINFAYNFAQYWRVFDYSLGLAQYLFATLAGLTVIVNVLAYYIRNQTIQGLGQTVLTSVLRLGLPFVIILAAPTILPAIPLIGLEIADIVTGAPYSSVANMTHSGLPLPAEIEQVLTDVYNAALGGPNNHIITALSPKAIVDEGVSIGYPLLQQMQTATAANQGNGTGINGPGLNSAVYNSNNMILGFVLAMAIGIIAMFTFIAVELVLAYLQIYLVLPVAAFTLGFLGSPATRQFGAGYWRVVVQALLRFTTVIFVVGFAMALAEASKGILTAITIQPVTPNAQVPVDAGLLKKAISAFIITSSIFALVRALPNLFGAVLSGADVGIETSQFENQAGGIAQQGMGGFGRFGGGTPLARTGRVRVPNTPGVPRTH